MTPGVRPESIGAGAVQALHERLDCWPPSRWSASSVFAAGRGSSEPGARLDGALMQLDIAPPAAPGCAKLAAFTLCQPAGEAYLGKP